MKGPARLALLAIAAAPWLSAGALAEGVVWSPDGKYLYAGNFMDSDVTILRLEGDRLIKSGTLKLPGHPASMRGSTPEEGRLRYAPSPNSRFPSLAMRRRMSAWSCGSLMP